MCLIGWRMSYQVLEAELAECPCTPLIVPFGTVCKPLRFVVRAIHMCSIIFFRLRVFIEFQVILIVEVEFEHFLVAGARIVENPVVAASCHTPRETRASDRMSLCG